MRISHQLRIHGREIESRIRCLRRNYYLTTLVMFLRSVIAYFEYLDWLLPELGYGYL